MTSATSSALRPSMKARSRSSQSGLIRSSSLRNALASIPASLPSSVSKSLLIGSPLRILGVSGARQAVANQRQTRQTGETKFSSKFSWARAPCPNMGDGHVHYRRERYGVFANRGPGLGKGPGRRRALDQLWHAGAEGEWRRFRAAPRSPDPGSAVSARAEGVADGNLARHLFRDRSLYRP